MKRAYRVTYEAATHDAAKAEVTNIVAAESHREAEKKLIAYVHAVYGDKARSMKFHVSRAPEHDAWAEVDSTGAAWDEQFLPKPTTERKGP